MEWNAESVLDALNEFERKPEMNPILEDYLLRIAKNGEIVFPWSKLKPLLKKKLEVVLDEFYETCPIETSVPVPNFETFNFDNLKKSILQAVDAFTSAPFTIQRLCELVTDPSKHYNRTDKYMRGIEKNVLVVSTIEPRTGAPADGNNSNNNVIVNGMINDSPHDDNDALNGHENESSDSVSSSNLNTPSNHVLLENFANVFPSAACIPSASNICINREIDSSFISTSECVDTPEDAAFDTPATTSEQTIENTDESKEEPMDVSEEDTSSSASVDSSDLPPSEVSDSAEEQEAEEIEKENKSPERIALMEPEVAEMEEIPSNENSGFEPDSSDNVEEPAHVDEVINSDKEEPQDNTVSQSDDKPDPLLEEDSSEAEEKQEESICDNSESGASVTVETESTYQEFDNVSESSSQSDGESGHQSVELLSEKEPETSPE